MLQEPACTRRINKVARCLRWETLPARCTAGVTSHTGYCEGPCKTYSTWSLVASGRASHLPVRKGVLQIVQHLLILVEFERVKGQLLSHALEGNAPLNVKLDSDVSLKDVYNKCGNGNLLLDPN